MISAVQVRLVSESRSWSTLTAMFRAGLFIAPDGDTTAANKEAGSDQSSLRLILRELPIAAAATTKAGTATSSVGADNEAAQTVENLPIGSGKDSIGNDTNLMGVNIWPSFRFGKG